MVANSRSLRVTQLIYASLCSSTGLRELSHVFFSFFSACPPFRASLLHLAQWQPVTGTTAPLPPFLLYIHEKRAPLLSARVQVAGGGRPRLGVTRRGELGAGMYVCTLWSAGLHGVG